MSNASAQRQMVQRQQAQSQVAPLRIVGGTQAQSSIATVTPISQAPSARLRRARLLAEDPAMRRRPVIDTGVSRVRSHTSARTASQRAQARGVQGQRSSLSFLRSATYAVIFAVSIVGAAALGLFLQPTPYAGPTIEHSVVAGDSVWSLAAAVASERPLEEVVLDIERMNDLNGALVPGQSLILPTR